MDRYSRTHLQGQKGKKELFFYKNIIPIPNMLVQSFLKLQDFDPDSVTLAFYHTMISKAEESQDDSNNENINHQSPTLSSIKNEEILNNQDDSPLECKDRIPTSIIDDSNITPNTRNNKRFTSKKIAETDHLDINSSPWINDLQHVIYFCYICSINKMDSIKYTIQNSEDVKIWQNSLESVHLSDLPFSQSSTFQTNNQVKALTMTIQQSRVKSLSKTIT
jgi:hypothetical protein